MTILGHSVDLMAVALIIGVIGLTYLLARAQKEPDAFDIRTIIMADGQVSVNKVGQFLALIVSTWAFVYLTLHDGLTEAFYLTYLGVWAGANAIQTKLRLDAKRDQVTDAPPEGTNSRP